MTIRVSGLYRYPVKSLAGNAPRALKLTSFGPEFDRRWMVVDENGRFLTQRELPAMARIGAEIDGASLVLRAVEGRCRVPLKRAGRRVEAQVWKFKGPAVDMGDEAAALLSRCLGKTVRLVRLPRAHKRTSSTGSKISFVDSCPLLVISRASLDLLNEKLPAPLSMDRFRPNIVLEGGKPHQEDGWKRIRIGSVELASVELCTRCSITTVDQESGVRLGPEPLKTLAAYRRRGDGVAFGCYYSFDNPGTIKVGDPVEPRG